MEYLGTSSHAQYNLLCNRVLCGPEIHPADPPWPSPPPQHMISTATAPGTHQHMVAIKMEHSSGVLWLLWPVIKVQSTATALDVWLSPSSLPDQVERRWIWFIMDLSVYYLQQPWWRSSCGKIIRSMRRRRRLWTKLMVETEETVDSTLKSNKQHVNQAHPRQVHEFGMQSSARGSGGEISTPDQKGRQTDLIFNSPGSSRLHPNLSGNYW